MSQTDHTHHLLDPLDESIKLQEVIDWVQAGFDGHATEEEIRVAFERTNGYVLPVQRKYADDHGETRYPVVLQIRGGARNRPILHLGQRFRIHAYLSKKRTGDFEITQIHTREEERGMDAHHITCKRVLKTKVSEAQENIVTFPHTAFDTAMPFDHYNRIVWEVLEFLRTEDHMLSLVSAPDPAKLGAIKDDACYAEVMPDPDEPVRSVLEGIQASTAISDRL